MSVADKVYGKGRVKIRPASPDDPIYRRGYVIGGRFGKIPRAARLKKDDPNRYKKFILLQQNPKMTLEEVNALFDEQE